MANVFRFRLHVMLQEFIRLNTEGSSSHIMSTDNVAEDAVVMNNVTCNWKTDDSDDSQDQVFELKDINIKIKKVNTCNIYT